MRVVPEGHLWCYEHLCFEPIEEFSEKNPQRCRRGQAEINARRVTIDGKRVVLPAGAERPAAKKIPVDPRVRRAERSTSGGRAKKGGPRTWNQKPKARVPKQKGALHRQWVKQLDEDGYVISAATGKVLLTDKRYSDHPCYAEPDRLIPELGYVDGNIRWIEKYINQAKSDTRLETCVIVGDYAARELLAAQERSTA